MTETKNAVITDTFLGLEKGFLTITLMLEFLDSDACGQRFGGWFLGRPHDRGACELWIRRVMKVAGVEK